MDKFEIGESFMDSDYRNHLQEAIHLSRYGIIILGKDLSLINYPEILVELRERAIGGLQIEIGLANAPKRIIQFLKESGLSLFKINQQQKMDESVEIDGHKVMTSYQDERNQRLAVWNDDPLVVRRFSEFFESIKMSKSTEVISTQVKSGKASFPTDNSDERDEEHQREYHHEIMKKYAGDFNSEILDRLEEIVEESRQGFL